MLSYIERKTLLFYQMGTNQEFARGSPGMITIYLVMEEAARRGYERFDFLAGEGRAQAASVDGDESTCLG